MRAETLAGVQRYVADAVRRTSPAPRDADVAEGAERLIAPGPRGMTAAERLEVYRGQFWLRHVANLTEDFPTLSWAVGGPAPFERLATEYLSACPPGTWDLQRLGAGMAEHVATAAPWRDDGLVADAARIDWAYVHAFDAPDAARVDPHRLAGVPEDAWSMVTIGFHPSLRALALGHPGHALRRAIGLRETVTRPAPAATFVAVWRDDACRIQDAELQPAAFDLLGALCAGRPLGEACEALACQLDLADPVDLGAQVTAWFQDWTRRGWIVTIQFEGRAA